MNHRWIGVCAGMLLAGYSQAQTEPAPPGEPPAESVRPSEPAVLEHWPEPAVPAYGTAPPGMTPMPQPVLRVSQPMTPRGGLRRPPVATPVIEMPSDGRSWYDRFRPGRRGPEMPITVPVPVQPVPVGMPQLLPAEGGIPQMLPEMAGENVILMEKAAQDQPPPAPGDLPPSSGSPTEPLQQLPQPRPVDSVEPVVAEFEVPPGQWWFGLEGLLWFVQRPPLPLPLLTTTSSAGATATTSTGALSSSSTLVLFDSETMRFGKYPGVRFSAGHWFAPERIFGLEANVFIIQASDSELTLAGSDVTSTVLSRPYVNAATDGQEAVVVAFPVNRTGSVSIGADSQVYGGEFNFVAKFIRGVETDWDLIAGLRCMVLEEGINVQQSTTAGTGNNMRFNGAAVAAGSVVSAFDSFETQNRFAGAQIGVRQECRLAHLLLGWQFKVAAGVNRQTIDINGASTRTTGGVTTTLPGGVLALPTNIGRVVLNDFTVVPQLQFTVGYQCAENLRFWAAYECLIWSNAVRPGAQIDPQLDVTQLPTSASFNAAAAATRPIATLDQNSVLIQGISIGMEMKY